MRKIDKGLNNDEIFMYIIRMNKRIINQSINHFVNILQALCCPEARGCRFCDYSDGANRPGYPRP